MSNEDVWKLAFEIYSMNEKTIELIFGVEYSIMVFEKFSPEQAYKILKDYERPKHIMLGDEGMNEYNQKNITTKSQEEMTSKELIYLINNQQNDFIIQIDFDRSFFTEVIPEVKDEC